MRARTSAWRMLPRRSTPAPRPFGCRRWGRFAVETRRVPPLRRRASGRRRPAECLRLWQAAPARWAAAGSDGLALGSAAVGRSGPFLPTTFCLLVGQRRRFRRQMDPVDLQHALAPEALDGLVDCIVAAEPPRSRPKQQPSSVPQRMPLGGPIRRVCAPFPIRAFCLNHHCHLLTRRLANACAAYAESTRQASDRADDGFAGAGNSDEDSGRCSPFVFQQQQQPKGAQ